MRTCFLLITACTLISGCGGSYEPQAEIFQTVTAAGVLTWKGKPLPGFVVSVHPADGKRTASGTTDGEGKFQLGTNTAGDGAVPGSHKISVVWQPPEDDGMGNVIDDPSKLPKPPVQLPPKYASPDTSGISLEIPESGSSELKLDLN
ncbi:MAG: hypothetical protein ACKON9_26990 [Planctomycetaceae bacterium]